MDFQNVNLLNSRVNMISGNLLPLGAKFSLSWKIYCVIVLLIEVTHMSALICGLTQVSKEKAIKDGTLTIVVGLEIFSMLMCLYTRMRLIEQIVQKMNGILQRADKIMNEIVKTTLKPVTMPFVIYGIVSEISVIIWTAQPILLIFDKTSFYYTDYNLPAVFSSQPFSAYILILTTVLMTLGSVYQFLKKFSIDVYMIHLVLLLTAQYRYTATKLTMLFQNSQNSKPQHIKTDRWSEKKLKELCRHQNNILRIAFMLKKLLSVNFSLLYLNSVFRFCFISVMISTIPSITFAEGLSVIFFSCGSIIQFYLLCFSVQTLSDASIEITDEAFNENWHQCSASVKRIFMLLILSNNLECKIAMVDKFNLSLSSFMTIMNQSYSIAVLFLKVN